jgi:hypothetical protein
MADLSPQRWAASAPCVKSYNRKVHRITKRQLKRAANVITDLITSL